MVNAKRPRLAQVEHEVSPGSSQEAADRAWRQAWMPAGTCVYRSVGRASRPGRVRHT